MGRSDVILWISAVVSSALTLYFYMQKLYVAMTYSLWVLFILGLLYVLKKRKLTAEEAVIIASLSALAAVGRMIFAPIPSVQPVSFIIICAASVFGWRTGLLIGLLSAFVSNLFLGQGPWTLWQMLAWGLMGITAGLLFNRLGIQSKVAKMAFGFVAGILFGWIMNLWYLASYIDNVSAAGILIAYGASFYMDLLHGLANVFFIAFFSGSLEKILMRMKKKYGLLDR
jgi:energy-coupling factor transport system substrate-specific component